MTWHLAAAMRLEATYGPCMRRLHLEVGRPTWAADDAVDHRL